MINHILLAIHAISLVIGIFAPMMTFQKFWIFSNKYSLFSGIFEMLKEGEIFMFFIILSFSILFPIYKLITLYQVQFAKVHCVKFKKKLDRLSALGKWSMMDVFVIAFLVMTVKLGGIGKVDVHIGIFAFSISVVVSMILTHRIQKKIESIEDVDLV